MKWLNNFKELFGIYKENEHLYNFILFGSNKLNNTNMGYKPGDKVIFNKKLLLCKKQIEFLVRIFILNYILLFTQQYLYSLLKFEFNILTKITFTILESLFIYMFFEYNFKKEIIDFFQPDNLKQLDKKTIPLKTVHFSIFITYTTAMIISYFSYIGSIGCEIIFIVLILIALLIFIDFSFQKTKKSEIYSFVSNTDKSKSKDNITLDKDFSITTKINDTYKINLLNSDFFICENDDILVIVSKHKENNSSKISSIILPTTSKEILEDKRFSKSSIAFIKIGKVIIKFDETSKSWSVA